MAAVFLLGLFRGARGKDEVLSAEEGTSRVLFPQLLSAGSLKEAQGLLKRLRQGESFMKLARQHAPEDLKDQVGYMGPVQEDSLLPAIRKAVSRLEGGQISDPVGVEGHYLIVKLLSPQEVASLQATKGTALYYLNLGLALGEIEDHEGEIRAYRKAVELDPRLKEVYVNLGEALRRKGMDLLVQAGRTGAGSSASAKVGLATLDEAIDQFKVALSIDPDYAEAHYNLGLAYVGEGLLDLALLEFQEAIRGRPADGEIHKSMACVYLLKREYETARVQAERARILGADVDELLRRIEAGQRDQHRSQP